MLFIGTSRRDDRKARDYMERFSLYEAIEQAVQTERLGFQFYSRAAEQFRGRPEVSELFQTLALKEQSHEERFSELKDKIAARGVEDWDEVSKYLRAIVESEFFLGRDKSLSLLETISTVSAAISAAVGFEKETLLYFYGVRDAIGREEIIDKIIAEEKSHLIWLREIERKILR